MIDTSEIEAVLDMETAVSSECTLLVLL